MNEKQKAWVYTRIDAPEDRYGSLKRQDQKLTEYASRMGWEVVGHSQDIGSCRDMNRLGLQALTDEVLCTSVLKDSALAVPEDSPNLSIH